MKSVTNNQKQTTRQIILKAIKESNQAKVEELAQIADISPVTVRHHLNSLLAEGLIESKSVRRKVGRPYYVYNLSEKGQEHFPQRYVKLTSRLLDELKAHLPEEVVTTLFAGVVHNVIATHKGKFEHLSLEDRLNYLIELLAEEGFLARWEKTADGYKVIEYSCPYLSVGQTHAEICSIDKELMLSILQTPIKQHSCMLEGANCCEFSIDETVNV